MSEHRVFYLNEHFIINYRKITNGISKFEKIFISASTRIYFIEKKKDIN